MLTLHISNLVMFFFFELKIRKLSSKLSSLHSIYPVPKINGKIDNVRIRINVTIYRTEYAYISI